MNVRTNLLLPADLVAELDQVAMAHALELANGPTFALGVAKKMFGALAARGINIAMINTSEVCVSVAVDRTRGEEAHRELKVAFGISG